jgi:hypothetical protein
VLLGFEREKSGPDWLGRPADERCRGPQGRLRRVAASGSLLLFFFLLLLFFLPVFGRVL